jgi:putative FmdB family regulatory protein
LTAGVDLIILMRQTLPSYEFICVECGREFMLVLSVREFERRDLSCPQCRSKMIESRVAACQVITSRKS